ncbi:MAG TPA: plasma-membrane proton-efflux P-type ATPase [Methanocella sp.]|nr:plasma-membrane proton-efflux P-type ATPase [Methanocella sp.]
MADRQKSLTEEYEKLPIGDVLGRLDVNADKGLSSESVKRKLLEFGYNEVTEKKGSALLGFAKRFWGMTPWMLEITIALSYILHRYVDLVVIAVLLVMNAVLGFIQERQAARAVESLKWKLNVQARVLRDGRWSEVPARNLAPGDVVRVRSGDYVPADLKVIEGGAEVDQSALTGESYAVGKKRGDVLYSGSVVRNGEVTCVTVSTGIRTYFGRTAELVRVARPRLYVEEVIASLLMWLLSLVVALLSIAVAVSWIRGVNLLDILPLLLVLLVSSIPVALPTMFTVTMALGSRELSRKGVLVTRLSASQDAAMMDVLCVDKTGTITSNKLSVTEVKAFDGFTDDDVLICGALASQEANQDPIDLAFLAAAERKKLGIGEYTRMAFLPFDPSRRRTEATVEKNGKRTRVAKGSVAMIASLCGYDSNSIVALEEELGLFANKGCRTIAVATGLEGQKMALAGVAALYDAPRPESAGLIAELRRFGVSTKMLTGDALPVAREVARQAGLMGDVLGMPRLMEAKDGNLELKSMIEHSDGFAGVFPEDKYAIVKSLQQTGHIVGMTGDGVNDAPALRQAEVGIAVSNATDIAKGAASAVLTHEGLSEIMELVKIGREIHLRIATWIMNKIIKTFEIVVFLVLSYLLTGIYVISAYEIVLMLFLVDFVTISLSTDNARPGLRPEKWDLAALAQISISLGLLIVAESFGLLFIGLRYLRLGEATGLHTFVLCMLIFGGMFTIFVVREKGYFWRSRPSNILLLAIAGDMIVTAVISILGIPGLTPIPAADVLLVIAWYFVFALSVNDLIKVQVLSRLVRA